MADIRAKALAYLREGRVRIAHASTAGTTTAAYDVLAYVTGHRTTYIVRHAQGEWGCSCRQAECAHVPPVQLVTGHPSAARKDPK